MYLFVYLKDFYLAFLKQVPKAAYNLDLWFWNFLESLEIAV